MVHHQSSPMVERSSFAMRRPLEFLAHRAGTGGRKRPGVNPSLRLRDDGVGMHGRTWTTVINEKSSLLRTDTISTGAAGLRLAHRGRTDRDPPHQTRQGPQLLRSHRPRGFRTKKAPWGSARALSRDDAL